MLKKVLVVDDSELIHNMYRLILKKYQECEVVKAMNGKEALNKLIVEDNIDLILLDINMPVMNGISFLENIRKEGKYTHIPIIIISTEGKEEDTKRGLKLGAKGYIVKPFKSVMLHNLIEDIVKGTAVAVG
ncbi:MAG: response regulator [Deltaproteobacteria bacterium]|nr:MAG: response regulator [Deltaproteobacteria bacterium]